MRTAGYKWSKLLILSGVLLFVVACGTAPYMVSGHGGKEVWSVPHSNASDKQDEQTGY